MTVTKVASERFRHRLRGERERHGISQIDLADILSSRYGLSLYGPTIAKIEGGTRSVNIDELNAFADHFGTSADALLGRPTDGADLMWAVSKLSSNAHKMIGEVSSLQQRLRADAQDVRDYAERGSKQGEVAATIGAVGALHLALETAKQAAVRLAGEFPLPGRG